MMCLLKLFIKQFIIIVLVPHFKFEFVVHFMDTDITADVLLADCTCLFKFLLWHRSQAVCHAVQEVCEPNCSR